MSQGAYFKIPIFILAFLTGIVVRSFFNVPQNLVLVGAGLALGFLVTLFFYAKLVTHPLTPSLTIREGGRKEINISFLGEGYFVVLVLLAFSLGILRFSVFENNIAKDDFHSHYGETLSFQGNVIKNELTGAGQRIILDTASGRIQITKKIYPQYVYGDSLEIEGKVLEPKSYSDFDIRSYLAKDKIYAVMSYPKIKKLSGAGGNTFFNFLFLAKTKFEENLRLILPEPQASLADGMLLGNQNALDNDLLNDFKTTGTIHILVLSGYNITVVGVFTLAFFGFFLPATAAWLLAITAILGFTLMSGAEASAVRSAIMAIIGLFALRGGRNANAALALLWAAFLMALWNPMLLRFDRGFQLSFLATLGLITAGPFFKKHFSFLPDFLGLRENAASSLAAETFILPLLLSWGSQISWLSPLANILIVWAVPVVMFFSFWAGVFSFISVFFGRIIASAAYLLISYQIYLVKLFGSLKFSMIQINFFPALVLIIIYAAFFYWAISAHVKTSGNL